MPKLAACVPVKVLLRKKNIFLVLRTAHLVERKHAQ